MEDNTDDVQKGIPTIPECEEIICKTYGYGWFRRGVLWKEIYSMACAYQLGFIAGVSKNVQSL